MEISLMIEGQAGLTWPRWKALVSEIDGLGFAGLYRSDHFTMPRGELLNALEMIVSLTYLADHTRRVHFGPLVAPVSFRDPVMLARQAMALDDLSNGRMILGVGAGWEEREHTMFGYPLGDVKTRMARFEEGLQVISLLMRSDGPVNFSGEFYNLRDALLLPRPAQRGRPPLLVGGNGRRSTLPLAARYADVWNGLAVSPEGFQELSAALDQELDKIGRAPGEVKRTLSLFLFFGATPAALEARLAPLRRMQPRLASLPLDSLLAVLHEESQVIAGLPDQVLEQLLAYNNAGVQELMLQVLDSDDLESFRTFSEQVLNNPSLRAQI